jgi:hypothetical protein
MAGYCKYGDEPSDSGATELVSVSLTATFETPGNLS